MLAVTTCPCGTTAAYAECCGRFIDGDENAPTAETLMRSRYTAYTMVRIDYFAPDSFDAGPAPASPE